MNNPPVSVASGHRPPPGASGWVCPEAEQIELLYLAWGERRYGRTELPAEARGDWVYVAPAAGAPTVVLNGRRRLLPAGQCLVLAPGCTAGYTDRPGGRCRIQTWVWRGPSRQVALQPPEGGFLIFKLSDAQRRELAEIHERCRAEVQAPDAFTRDALEVLRARLDLCLARGPSGRAAAPSPAQRVELALRWIREHLTTHQPVAGLTDYLQISAPTLHRLFVERLGYGPREAARRVRLEEARRLIEAEGWSVKATAFHLGYKHANDLSRARRERSASTQTEVGQDDRSRVSTGRASRAR